MPTIKLTTSEFKKKVFDYSKEKDWKYKGDTPALIDFYADWCGPCQAVAPVLEKLSEQYDGKLIIYKVDTEVERELSTVFRIRSIPSLLFIPTHKPPLMQAGALPQSTLEEIIEKELLTPASAE